jgi:hypothetical protein
MDQHQRRPLGIALLVGRDSHAITGVDLLRSRHQELPCRHYCVGK